MNEKELAKQYRCNVRTIRRWKADGAPLSSPGDMSVWLSSRKEAPGGTAEALKDFDGLADLATAKLEKLIVECKRLQHKLDVEQKKYVLLSDVRADELRIQSAIRLELDRLVGTVPGWVGFSAVELSNKMAAFRDSVCENLSNEHSALYS